MSSGAATGALVEALLAERTEANRRFFAAEADRIARLCHRMAERFARGGRLVALGASPAARSDARHVAVEFVHPVIVGKRALPALGLAAEGGPLAAQAEGTVEPDDVVVGFEADGDVVVNDPAGATNAAVRRVYDRAQFERIWIAASGGTAYVVRNS